MNPQGEQTNKITYDAFGNTISGSIDEDMPFGYNGKVMDTDTNQYNYGYRDYTPTAGRFSTLDPIKDGTSWYDYCGNDPVNFVDFWGLCVEHEGTINIGINLTGTNLVNWFKDTFNSVQKLFAPDSEPVFDMKNKVQQGTISGGLYIDLKGIGLYGTFGSGGGTPELTSAGVEMGVSNKNADTYLKDDSIETGGGYSVPLPNTGGIVSV